MNKENENNRDNSKKSIIFNYDVQNPILLLFHFTKFCCLKGFCVKISIFASA